MSRELGNQMLPNWFINNFITDPMTERIDKKRWIVANIVAIVCLAMTSICSMSTKKSLSRLVTSMGFDLFGEFTNGIANLAISGMMIQHLTCQLINYRTYRSSNYQTMILTQPIRAESKNSQWDIVFTFGTMVGFIVYVGLSIVSTHTIYGLIWWLMMYKIMIGTFIGFAVTKVFKTLIANCLFLNLTCQRLLSEISKLYLKLVIDGHRGKTKQIRVFTLCVEFQSICITLNNYNRYWKKVIFTIMSTIIPIITSGIFVAIEWKSTLFRSILSSGIFAMMVAASLVILTPAKVEAQLRKCYPLMCSLLRHRTMTWRLKMSLLRLVKQFDNQISFTSWDTNKIDYMDYNEVSV